jgi:hypothetical protein
MLAVGFCRVILSDRQPAGGMQAAIRPAIRAGAEGRLSGGLQYGLIEFMLRAQVDGSEEQQIACGLPVKPAANDKAESGACPLHPGAPVQPVSSGGLRCAQCGYQWGGRAAVNVSEFGTPITRMRSAHIARGNTAERLCPAPCGPRLKCWIGWDCLPY